jgi:flagellar basal body-associated protein FliL
MSSRSIGILLAALIIALTVGMIIVFFWSLQNRVPPASNPAKPIVQGAPSARSQALLHAGKAGTP